MIDAISHLIVLALDIIAIAMAIQARNDARLAIRNVSSSRAERLAERSSSSLYCSSCTQILANCPTSSVRCKNCLRVSSSPSFSNSGEYGSGFDSLMILKPNKKLHDAPAPVERFLRNR